jgi:hypothetical protein
MSGLKVYSTSSFFGGSYFFLSAYFYIVGGILALAYAISAFFRTLSPRLSSSSFIFLEKIRTEQALGIGLALKVGLLISGGYRSAGFTLVFCLARSLSQKLKGASLSLVFLRD